MRRGLGHSEGRRGLAPRRRDRSRADTSGAWDEVLLGMALRVQVPKHGVYTPNQHYDS